MDINSSNQPLIATCQCHLYSYLLSIQHIILVLPWYKPAVDPTKSAIKHSGLNNQRLGSPCSILNADTTQDRRRADKRSTYQNTSTDQWKFGVHGVKPWRSPARIPHTNNYCRGLHGIDGISVCTAAQPWKLPPHSGDHPRASSRNQKVPTKSSTFQNMHLRGQNY